MKRAHETFQSCYGAEHPHTTMAQRQVELRHCSEK
jgi:hypothetical protein